MIPEQRLTLSIRGFQGFGKSTLAGACVKWALNSGQFERAYLYLHPKKIEDTLPKYPKEVTIPETSLTMRWIQKYKNSIIIAEDAMRLNERSRKTFENLVSFLGRANKNLVIEVTQEKKPTYPSATDIVCKWNNNRFFYKIFQLNVSTDDIEWTCSSEPNIERVEKALERGISLGVPITTLGKVGRPRSKTSLYTKCFELFDLGKTASETIKILNIKPSTKEYDAVYVYYRRWRLYKVCKHSII